MAIKSTDKKLGRYAQGGVTDIYTERLGWWERIEMEASDDDITITITPTYNLRPDLLAYDLYKKTSLMWLVLLYNNIVDVEEEFVTGKVIKLPSPTRVFFSLTNKPSNGNYVE